MEHLQTFDESPLTLRVEVGNSVKLVGREWDVHDLTSIDTETGLPIAYADGQKTAAELVKRWNAYPELVEALKAWHYAFSECTGTEQERRSAKIRAGDMTRAAITKLNQQ